MRDVLNIRSIWGPAGFIELSAPGTQRYSVQIRSDDEWVWDFVWCATSKERLDEILLPLTLSFNIDQVRLPDDNFYEYEGEARTLKGWQCHYWVTILRDWQPGADVELDIFYSLSQQIFDGENVYPAGDYRQIIKVMVQ